MKKNQYVWVLSRCEYQEGGSVVCVVEDPGTAMSAFPGKWIKGEGDDYWDCAIDSPEYYTLERFVLG